MLKFVPLVTNFANYSFHLSTHVDADNKFANMESSMQVIEH